MLTKFTLSTVLLVLTLAFGFLLSRLGKPYNSILFNIHKLIALAAVVLGGYQFFLVLKATHAQGGTAPLLPLLLMLAAVCVVALFASGALMSADKWSYRALLVIHQVAPVLLVLTGAGSVYLLAGAPR